MLRTINDHFLKTQEDIKNSLFFKKPYVRYVYTIFYAPRLISLYCPLFESPVNIIIE